LIQIKRNIVESCVAQKRDAQKQLYLLLLPYLRAVANRYLRDTSYAKDALQESFVKIFKNIEKYDFDKAPLKQWAARITINVCLNYNKRVIGLPLEEFIVEQHDHVILPVSVQNISDENLLLILKKMPDGYFEVFNLFVIDGYSHDETAKMLGISEALSRKRMSRARNWLKKTFQEKPDLLNQFNIFSNSKNKGI